MLSVFIVLGQPLYGMQERGIKINERGFSLWPIFGRSCHNIGINYRYREGTLCSKPCVSEGAEHVVHINIVFQNLVLIIPDEHVEILGSFRQFGGRELYTYVRAAFPDFHAEIHWQLADGDRVTTYKTYYGTHEGPFLGVAPTNRKIHFETVDVMRVQNGKITDHWGVGNLLSLMQQIGGWTPPEEAKARSAPKL